jgi:hypothetical protein
MGDARPFLQNVIVAVLFHRNEDKHGRGPSLTHENLKEKGEGIADKISEFAVSRSNASSRSWVSRAMTVS